MITLLLSLTKEIVEIPTEAGYEANNFVVVSDNGVQEIAQILAVDERPARGESDRVIKIERAAAKVDIDKAASQHKIARNLIPRAQEIVKEAGLDMYIWDANTSLDGKRSSFLFLAKEYIDFRDLVPKLATEFGQRIHLQQVGPRDRAKLCQSLGICGRQLCCTNFLKKFPQISMDIVRAQHLGYRSPDKISGQCGRLLCCLQYELEAYQELNHDFPCLNEEVKFAGGTKTGRVLSNDVLSGVVKVLFQENNQRILVNVPLTEISGKYKTIAERFPEQVLPKEK